MACSETESWIIVLRHWFIVCIQHKLLWKDNVGILAMREERHLNCLQCSPQCCCSVLPAPCSLLLLDPSQGQLHEVVLLLLHWHLPFSGLELSPSCAQNLWPGGRCAAAFTWASTGQGWGRVPSCRCGCVRGLGRAGSPRDSSWSGSAPLLSLQRPGHRTLTLIYSWIILLFWDGLGTLRDCYDWIPAFWNLCLTPENALISGWSIRQ